MAKGVSGATVSDESHLVLIKQCQPGFGKKHGLLGHEPCEETDQSEVVRNKRYGIIACATFVLTAMLIACNNGHFYCCGTLCKLLLLYWKMNQQDHAEINESQMADRKKT